MPIPGPVVPQSVPPVLLTRSPFWLSVNGTWVTIEGTVPTASITPERPRSAITSVDGRRFEQHAPLARRSWAWTIPYAARAHVATVAAAVDSPHPVWLMSDPVSVGNMLPAGSCFGTELPAIDCGGVPLPTFAGGEVVTHRVRGGVPTTLSAWGSSAISGAVDVTYPGGSTSLDTIAGQSSVTFTPSADGSLTLTINDPCSGLQLTEGDPQPSWVPGESMPCQVVVDDPADTLLMWAAGAWRHDYTVTLREVD